MQEGKIILDPNGRRNPKKRLNIQNNSYNKQSHSQNGCIGSYQVSGYTRADGTEVKGYTRHCGAKHIGVSQEERIAGQNKYRGKKFQDIPQNELETAISYFL